MFHYVLAPSPLTPLFFCLSAVEVAAGNASQHIRLIRRVPKRVDAEHTSVWHTREIRQHLGDNVPRSERASSSSSPVLHGALRHELVSTEAPESSIIEDSSHTPIASMSIRSSGVLSEELPTQTHHNNGISDSGRMRANSRDPVTQSLAEVAPPDGKIAQKIHQRLNRDCKWRKWDSWSPCTVSCGGGDSQRSRTYRPAEGDGDNCEGPAQATKDCNLDLCPTTREVTTTTLSVSSTTAAAVATANHSEEKKKSTPWLMIVLIAGGVLVVLGGGFWLMNNKANPKGQTQNLDEFGEEVYGEEQEVHEDTTWDDAPQY